jgi:hypothetical protein
MEARVGCSERHVEFITHATCDVVEQPGEGEVATE